MTVEVSGCPWGRPNRDLDDMEVRLVVASVYRLVSFGEFGHHGSHWANFDQPVSQLGWTRHPTPEAAVAAGSTR